MSRRAFVVMGHWPFARLTNLGQITWCCAGGTEGHMGIFIPCCTPEEISTHSTPGISEPSARNAEHVTFDYMMDLYPRFQSSSNQRYWTEDSETWCYPILDVDAADVHAACVEIAYLRPYNHGMYRLNGLCGGFWPCHTWPSNTPDVAQSTCAALSMRIIARAKAGNKGPYTSDAATLDALGIPSCGCSNPCGVGALTGYRPRGALEALQRAHVVGRPLKGFDSAISLCKGGLLKTPLGSALPDLRRMKRG